MRRVVLRGHHPTLHVDDAALDAATEATAGAAAVVSVGGGTITDIAKVATGRHGQRRHGRRRAASRSSWCRPRPRSTATPTTSRWYCATA